MGKMPIALRRYWAKRRGTKRKGGTTMAKKKGTRSKQYGRQAYGAVRRGGSRIMRMFGVGRSSFHVSNAIIMGGVVATAILPATSDPNSSVVGILSGSGSFAGQPLSQRLQNAANAAMVVGLGRGAPGTTYGVYKGAGGLLVVSGAGMKIAGKFVNPLMAGSPVKL